MIRTPVTTVLMSLFLLSAVAGQNESTRMTAANFSGVELRNIGPAMMAGRIADIAIHPDTPSASRSTSIAARHSRSLCGPSRSVSFRKYTNAR